MRSSDFYPVVAIGGVNLDFALVGFVIFSASDTFREFPLVCDSSFVGESTELSCSPFLVRYFERQTILFFNIPFELERECI